MFQRAIYSKLSAEYNDYFYNREGGLMKKNVCILSSLVIIVLLTMTSCATTTLNAVWKDESYQGEITNVLVIGVSKQPVRKRYCAFRNTGDGDRYGLYY
jgi:hypothetical protein